MRSKSDDRRSRLALVLYILSGIALVCGLGMSIHLFQFNFDAKAHSGQQSSIGFVARTEWQIFLTIGLVVGDVDGLIGAWRGSESSDTSNAPGE